MTRRALALAWPSWIAAAGSAVTASKEASAVRVSTASGTLVSVPDPVAATASSSTAHTVRPAAALDRPAPSPLADASRRASLASPASAAAALASAASAAANACRSAAPVTRSVKAAVNSPRAGALRRAARRAPAAASHGTRAPAASSPAASTPAAGARISRHAVTAPAPTTNAVNGGAIPRRNTSCVVSTSLTSRASRSPDRNSCSPAGASRTSRR